jgi:hypothetical protein
LRSILFRKLPKLHLGQIGLRGHASKTRIGGGARRTSASAIFIRSLLVPGGNGLG